MPSANLRMDLGRKAKSYLRVLDKKAGYKRGSVEYKSGKGTLEIKVTAQDPVALVSALSGALKQLRIITSVDNTVSKLTAEESVD